MKGWMFPLKHIEKITGWLNKLPKVRWDRISQKRGHTYVFGWIDREDNYKDFFLVDFVRGEPVDYCTSNAKNLLALRYSKILGLYHQKCWRVEESLKGVKNAIKNKENAGQENP